VDTQDPVRPEDYRRMFRVLEDVANAPDLYRFRLDLQEAFARRLGWPGVVVLAGSTPELTSAGRPGTDHFGRSYTEEYVERWWRVDPLASPRAEELLRTRGVAVLRDLLAAGSEPEHAFADDFLRRYHIADIVGAVAGAGPAGIGYFGVPLSPDQPLGARERAIVHKLRRQLATYFQQHLAHARQRTGDPRLTAREREVGELVSRGYSNDEIARMLFVTVDTVKKHVSRVLVKTGCASRTQLAVYWLSRVPPRTP
jgi:DNA-binding CsgD family transcriptional regulator